MTYSEFINQILQLQEEGLELFNAGKSVLGKNLLATHVGDYSGPQVLIQGGIHAREYITSLLMVEQARNLHNNDLVKGGGIYFIFNTDPDGAALVLDGLSSVPCEITKQYLTLANNGNEDFSQYKANINLVDLNTNFDANWGGGSQNVTCPSTEDFIGFYPNSEREVKSLIDFTLKNKPLLTISYHTKGNVIYYGFEGQSEANRNRDLEIGNRFSELTGYPLILTENSTGGYKDWVIQKTTVPSYTFEVGDETLPHPLGIETLPEIYMRNNDVPLLALELAKEYAKDIDFISPIVQNVTNGENINAQNNTQINNIQAVGRNERGYLARLQSWFSGRNSNRRGNS